MLYKKKKLRGNDYWVRLSHMQNSSYCKKEIETKGHRVPQRVKNVAILFNKSSIFQIQ